MDTYLHARVFNNCMQQRLSSGQFKLHSIVQGCENIDMYGLCDGGWIKYNMRFINAGEYTGINDWLVYLSRYINAECTREDSAVIRPNSRSCCFHYTKLYLQTIVIETANSRLKHRRAASVSAFPGVDDRSLVVHRRWGQEIVFLEAFGRVIEWDSGEWNTLLR